jgi:hypothetical protein
MTITRSLLVDYAGVEVEASVAMYRECGWGCDCEVLFCSDSSPEERRE